MELSDDVKRILGEDSWQFYRCYKCGRIISALELSRGLRPKLGESAKACPCGSLKCQPTQITAEDYAKPQVIEMAVSLGFTRKQYLDDFDMEAQDKMLPARMAMMRGEIEELYQ